MTLDGYTVAQTTAELRPMIRGARQKGFGEVHIDEDDPLAGYTIMSAQELSAKVFPPIDWLIPKLLPKPALTMLAGPPKVGKSWLCFFFALQVAEAGHEVVYLASEDNALNQAAIRNAGGLKALALLVGGHTGAGAGVAVAVKNGGDCWSVR